MQLAFQWSLLPLLVIFFVLFLNRTIFDVIVFLNIGVKSVFYLVLRSSRQMLADLRPLSSQLFVENDDFAVFFIVPLIFLDFGIKLVDEPLSDLLPGFGA